MKVGASTSRACLWLLVMAVAGLSLVWLGATDAVAQGCQPGQPCFDHLKCYQVLRDGHKPARHIVDLFNQQFGPEKCKMADRAAFLCAPTDKRLVDDHPPSSPFQTRPLEPTEDFLCYKVTCQPAQKHQVQVADQFAARDMLLGNARLLCAPARKPPVP